MNCTRFFGHKWSRWFKGLGIPKESTTIGKYTRQVFLLRRCAICGYIQQEWMSTHHVYDAPVVEEDGKDT